MNCLAFRRLKLADPRRLSEAARTHAQGCAGCAAFARSVDEGDTELVRALAVPVPEGLADRVLLRATGVDRPAWRAWALAASIFLSVGIATTAFVYAPSGAHARLAIEHVVHEPESLTSSYQENAATVAMALRSVGASIKSPIGQVRYLRLCPWGDGGTAWHIVFDSPQGLATLIVVADMRVRSKSEASSNGWNASVRPIRRGFYAVVTASPAATGLVSELLRERIDWNT
jgi:uncharacterized protein DUF3379